MSLTIKLVRHGESEANAEIVTAHAIGDYNVNLTETGREQARRRGQEIGADFLKDALIYCSPYTRTRQTLDELLIGSGLSNEDVNIYEDPRLREVEHGYDDPAEQRHAQNVHGYFYYRFTGGESPADCYDRTSAFLESMMRQTDRDQTEHVLIVTHGLTIRCFVMRFLHLSVEQFESLENPDNCSVVTLGHKDQLVNPQFCTSWAGVEGLVSHQGAW